MIATVKILTNNRAMGGIQNEIDKVNLNLVCLIKVKFFENIIL